MKVLIVGAGVIGAVYGAHLSAGGHTVSVLRHGLRTDEVAKTGLMAHEVGTSSPIVSPVTVVPDVNAGAFDLVLVAVRRDQLATAVETVSALAGRPAVVFFGNNPAGRAAVGGRESGDIHPGFPGVDGIVYALVQEGVKEGPVIRVATPVATTIGTLPAPAERGIARQTGSANLTWEQTGGAADAKVDPLGRLWVSHFPVSDVSVLDLDGNEILRIGGNGTEPGLFNFNDCQSGSGYFAFDLNGDAYITDCGNARVQEFAPDGAFIRQFGTRGTGEGQFNGMCGIAVVADGRIYVVDPERAKILVFTADGAFQFEFGEHGTKPGQMSFPVAVHTAADGNLWVNPDTGFLDLYAPDGTYLRSIGGSTPVSLGEFNDFTFDKVANLWLADFPNYQIRIVTSDGQPLYAFGGKTVSPRSMQHPLSLDVRGSSVFVTDDVALWLRKYLVTLPDAPPSATPVR